MFGGNGRPSRLGASCMAAIVGLAVANPVVEGYCPSGCGGRSIPASPAGARCGVALGSAEIGAPGSMAEISAVEDQIHQHLAIVHWYQGWGPAMQPEFNVDLLRATSAHGSVPLVTWEPWNGEGTAANPFPLQQIAAGAFDDYVDSWAAGMRAYGGPVLLVFAHEMQGDWYPWGAGVNGNTAEDYVAAYTHVHDRFTMAGATNVRWVWTVLADQNFPSLERFYPGGAYTDWFGLDVYNNGTTRAWSSWHSLGSLLQPVYDTLSALDDSKPVALVEWASVEAGGNKAAWIMDAAESLLARFQHVRAAVWFSSDSSEYSLRSSPPAVAAARAAFGGPAFCSSFDPS